MLVLGMIIAVVVACVAEVGAINNKLAKSEISHAKGSKRAEIKKMAGSNAQLSNSREPKGLPKSERRVKTPFHLKFILVP